MSLAEDRARLREILLQRSVRRGGEFVLASGRKSNVYVDARVTTCRAEAIPLIGRLLLARIRARGWNPAAVGGMTLGADPIVIAVARESLEEGPAVNAFLVRKEPKGHGTRRQIEGLGEAGPVDVVVVDDVCTTGATLDACAIALRAAGARAVHGLTLARAV